MKPKYVCHRVATTACALMIGLNSARPAFAGPAPVAVSLIPEKKDMNPLSFFEGGLVFDVEERVRGEVRENNRDFDSSVDDDNDDAWLLNRFRLGLAVKPSSWLKLYAQTQDAREAGSDRANIPGVRGAEGDDVFDLRQLSIFIGDPKHFPLTLSVGRQLLTYGDSRLVADSKWSNFGRSFNAVKLRYEEREFWIETFIARPVQIKRHDFNDSDAADNFGGIYISTTLVPKQTTDVYLFYRDKHDNQPDLDPTNKLDPDGTWNGPAARFATVGARVKSKPGEWSGWDYTGEIAFEAGDIWVSNRQSTRLNLSAFALHASGGYTAEQWSWKPRVGLEYDFASGDDNPRDQDFHSFQNLFPSNHEKYGFMDEFSWRNLHDARLQISAKPVNKLDLELDYHAFWLATTEDFWYRSNGISALRTKTPAGLDVRTIGAGNFAGHEIDLTASYELTKNIRVHIGYSHFLAGDYLSDTGPHSDADFAYFMTTFSY
jgi:Alginate export